MNPPTDDIPSPRKRADFPQVFRHERTLANRLRETSRLPTATAPQGVHSQKQRQAAPTGDSHNDRPGHASIILAGPRSHCGISSRRPFLWLSTRTPLCRRPRSSSHRVAESARSTIYLLQIICVSHLTFSPALNVSSRWCCKLKRHKAQVVFLAAAEAQHACPSLSHDLRYAKNP